MSRKGKGENVTSGKTKHARLQALRNNEQCLLIGDRKQKIYHRKDCSVLERSTVHKEGLFAIRYSVERGFRPCRACNPTLPTPERKAPYVSPIGEKLQDTAILSGMRPELTGNIIHVASEAGKWKFDYKASPVVLFRERTGEEDGYRQAGTFGDPISALAYIQAQTYAAITREVVSHPVQLRLDTVSGKKPRLFCGKKKLKPGDRMRALFPDGWQEICLGARKEGTGLDYWYAYDSKCVSYSPEGLFVDLDSIGDSEDEKETEREGQQEK